MRESNVKMEKEKKIEVGIELEREWSVNIKGD